MNLRSRARVAIPLFSAAVFLLHLLAVPALGQLPPDRGRTGRMESETTDVIQSRFGETIVRLAVFSENLNTRLDRQSVAKITNVSTHDIKWAATDEKSQAILGLPFGKYEIEVSAVGYLSERKESMVGDAINAVRIEFVLRKDPNAVDLNVADEEIPPKARGDAKRAVSALKSGNFKEAEKRLDVVSKLAPDSPQANFLLGYLSLQRRDFEKAEAYLVRSATLGTHSVQTLILLGRVQLQRQHYEDARKTLEQAVAANSQNWMAHSLLADACLKLKDYEKARIQAQLALDQGKGAANEARLALGQALANVGRDAEGVQALKTFLQNSPESPTAPAVRSLITQIEIRDSNPPGSGRSGEMQLGTDVMLSASQPELPDLPPSSWGPPEVDSVKLSVAPDVTCPVEHVLDMSGERVKEMVDDVAKFAATEDLVHEKLDKTGKAVTRETRTFDYLASISESRHGFLAVDEFRNERHGVTDLPDHIVTWGFMFLALIFHPDMRDNYQMSCEGLGDWHGQATWIVHFQQRADRPNRMQAYVVGNDRYPINLKGRAWITADKFQIVRIESELVNPVLQLAVQHQIVEYGPVPFRKQNVDLWLPKKVDLYLEFNRHLYHRQHSFDHYALFAVDAVDKPKEPRGNLQNP
jgi:tetratricopeptide (TPR) repeat protein